MATCFLTPASWEKRRNESRINYWIPLAYSYNEMTYGILNNISSTLDIDIDYFYHKRYHLLNDRVTNTNRNELGPLLQEYLSVFNSIFFHNALVPNRVHLNFVRTDSDLWLQDGHKLHGWTSDIRGDVRDDNDRLNISSDIWIFENADEELDEERLREYLSTLLHEMVHALLNIYVCGCTSCRVRYHGEQGSNGHGTAWQEMAHWIEVFCFERLQLKLDLGRAQAMAEEIRGSEERIEIYDEQMRRLGLDVAEVGALMDGMPSRDDSGERSWAGQAEGVFEAGNNEEDSSGWEDRSESENEIRCENDF